MNRRQFIAGLIGTGAIASGIGCLLCRKTEFTDIHPVLLYTVVFSGDTHSRSENDYARGYSFAYDWLLEMKWRERNKNLDQFIDITDSFDGHIQVLSADGKSRLKDIPLTKEWMKEFYDRYGCLITEKDFVDPAPYGMRIGAFSLNYTMALPPDVTKGML